VPARKGQYGPLCLETIESKAAAAADSAAAAAPATLTAGRRRHNYNVLRKLAPLPSKLYLV